VSAGQELSNTPDGRRLRIRNAAIGLASVALAFYFGFIALLVFRAHH
jgi:hypothetical protein